MSNTEKTVYYFLKRYIHFLCIYDPVYSLEINCYKRTRSNRAWKNEVDDIISFLYNAFRGKGERRRFSRIKRHYTRISIKRIQKWLNSNKNHFKTNPIFSNKPPLTPVISKNVQVCIQIDLVNMRSMTVLSNCTQYNYILSVLDVFFRYLRLWPLLQSWSI